MESFTWTTSPSYYSIISSHTVDSTDKGLINHSCSNRLCSPAATKARTILSTIMGIFRSLKGTHADTIGGPPSHSEPQSDPSEKHFARSTSSNQTPTHPQSLSQSNTYEPLHYAASASQPSGYHTSERRPAASPSLGEPPPYHDWTVIPDPSPLPPPPTQGHEQPAKNNADSNEADRAHHWCRVNPLVFPHQPTLAHTRAISEGDVRLVKPHEYRGDLLMLNIGSWKGSTKAGMKDACLLTSSPLYFASADSPVHTRHPKTIYFEVEIQSMDYVGNNDESTIALGYCAIPYPTWRLPGWQRASLAVHSDVCTFSIQ